jgi:hypothetical protein
MGLMKSDSGYRDEKPPYLLGDKGYSLLNCINIHFKDDG